jgi:ABC-type multidrug transport system ATPase subunit
VRFPSKLTTIIFLICRSRKNLSTELLGRKTSGEITLNDSPITKDVKRKICYVLQQDVFFETLTLKDTLQVSTILHL